MVLIQSHQNQPDGGNAQGHSHHRDGQVEGNHYSNTRSLQQQRDGQVEGTHYSNTRQAHGAGGDSHYQLANYAHHGSGGHHQYVQVGFI